jgi:excisionase family DNA binding protein
MENKLVTIGQASKMLGVSISTLRRWDKSGVMKSTRAGIRGHRYYAQSDIENFLK